MGGGRGEEGEYMCQSSCIHDQRGSLLNSDLAARTRIVSLKMRHQRGKKSRHRCRDPDRQQEKQSQFKKRQVQRLKGYQGWEEHGTRGGWKSQTEEGKLKRQRQKQDKEENKEKGNDHRQKWEGRLSRCPDKITAHEQMYRTDVAAAILDWSNPSVSETLIYLGSDDKRKWAELGGAHNDNGAVFIPKVWGVLRLKKTEAKVGQIILISW